MGMIANLKAVTSDELNNLLNNPSNLSKFLFEDDADSFDLDKSWHAIHYLLNGQVWEFSSVAGSLFLGGGM